jgi:Domain of unknown function (DUF4338)
LARPANRAEIARRVAAALDWRSPSGRHQLMSARVALLRLHRLGLISLPAPTKVNANGRHRRLRRQATWSPPAPLARRVDELESLELAAVSSAPESLLYHTLLERYHYLGYSPLAGAQIRYLVRCREGVLGVLGFGASAWRLQPRDQWIGWKKQTQERPLHLILNNSRFLILPMVRCANLGSKVLSLAARRVGADFQERYGYTPVLLESFVEVGRFQGTVYRAANWIEVGWTQGRGKEDRQHQAALPRKAIWLYALRRDFRAQLGAPGGAA